MFESLTERLNKSLRNIRGVGKLTESNIADALKDVRSALLSADVHFRVAREFVDKVKDECLGQAVIQSVTPGQMIIKIINDELTKLLGEGNAELSAKRPLSIILIGLHGSGKTTTSAKLAHFFSKQNQKVLLVGLDVYRPAAIDQLQTLAEQQNCLFFAERDHKDVPKIATRARSFAEREQADVIIFDTAGRLQIDEPLIEELKQLKKVIHPQEVLLVGDAALGQEAVNIARTFNEATSLTGIILTKLDGDARGGAALSMKTVAHVPIKFIGTGEKPDDFSPFYPDRLANRILGMGDITSLVEIAEEKLDEAQSERMAKRMLEGKITFQDLLDQIRQIKKLGSMKKIVGMLPGMNNMEIDDTHEQKMKRNEAILLSMTPEERQKPQLLNASRRRRIALGAGQEVSQVNALTKQLNQMQKVIKGKKGRKFMEKMMHQGKSFPG